MASTSALQPKQRDLISTQTAECALHTRVSAHVAGPLRWEAAGLATMGTWRRHRHPPQVSHRCWNTPAILSPRAWGRARGDSVRQARCPLPASLWLRARLRQVGKKQGAERKTRPVLRPHGSHVPQCAHEDVYRSAAPTLAKPGDGTNVRPRRDCPPAAA
uniref:Uncharacterized protein n=1 Tax=Rousettus aegyptiacus TaxID=9407 RepID=A0A7J8JGM6_ROUAE|nr:hypothetical protein HJG63_010088 [Rousettus aegyptiacus]